MSTQDVKQETKTESLPQNITPGFGSLQSYELSLRTANLLSKSTLVPREYQGQNGLPNCVVALNMAGRMNADPFMVMQNLHVIQGRPSWSSQFLISTFNTCGRFSAIRYEFFGNQGSDDWGCRAWAIEKATGEKLVGSDVTIGIAKKEGWYSKNGSKWQSMPQQMLQYRAAAWFVRSYAPELAMGMHTEEEIIDITPNNAGIYETQVANEIATNGCSETIDIQQEPQPETQNGKPTEKTDSKPEEQQTSLGGPGF